MAVKGKGRGASSGEGSGKTSSRISLRAENEELKSRLAHAEEKLRAFQRVIDATPTVIAYVDAGHVYRIVNRAHDQVVCRSAEEVVGRPVREVLGDAAWKMTLPFAERALAGEDVRYEREITLFDGEPRWFRVTYVPDPGPTGQIAGIVVLADDITMMKAAQKAVTQSETKYRTYVDHAPVGVLVADATGQCEEANRAAEAMLGCEKGGLLKTRFPDLYLPEDSPAAEHLFAEVSEKGLAASVARLRRQDGKTIWTSVQAVKVGDDRILAILQDLTMWIQAEEALCRRNAQLQVVLDATADGILAVDGKGKVLRANKRFADLWRIPQSVLDSTEDDELVRFVLDQLADPDSFLRKVNDLYARAEPALDTIHFKDGRVFERYSTPLLEDGEPAGRVWSFRDITARREAEESLRRSKQEIEESNSALRVLLRQREDDRKEMEEKFLANVKQLVMPYIEALKGRSLPPEATSLLNIISANLVEMTSSFAVTLSGKLFGLTAKEILVADLVKDGKQDKDIADLLNVSVETVKAHRRNIRKKLGLSNRKINLRTFLASALEE